MRRITLLLSTLAFANAALADEAPAPTLSILPAGEAELADFEWQSRLVVVFGDGEDDPRFQTQIELLQANAPELIDRDVIVLTDTDPKGESELRLKLRPRGFMLVLIGKDGGVKLRKPFPWKVRELTRVIDKTVLRQREVRDRRDSES